MAPARITIAFDLGRRCGWAVLGPDGERRGSGTWRLGDGREAWRTMRDNTTALILDWHAHGLVDVSYEKVNFAASMFAAHVYGALKCIVEMVTLDLDLPCSRIATGTWKKIACGSGSATKPRYIAVAQERYHLVLEDRPTAAAMIKANEDECAALGIAYARLVDLGGPVRLVAGQQGPLL